jgi:ribonucleotide reductase beta subunit family protein with ferritin-like domain
LKLTAEEKDNLFKRIQEVGRVIGEHEERINDMFFEKGAPRGYTLEAAKAFVRSRVNICLSDLGVAPVFPSEPNPVADWFYTSAQGYQAIDFFTGIGREYQRGWDEKSFEWKHENKDNR